MSFYEKKISETPSNEIGTERDFIELMFHDFKGCLTVISSSAGISAMMVERGKPLDPVLDYLRIIEEEAVRFQKILQFIQNYYQGRKVGLFFKNVRLLELFTKVKRICEQTSPNHPVRIEINCDPDLEVFCEENLMVQVFFNLIGNSGRHMESGAVELEGKKQGDRVIILVKDHGDGIDPEIRESIFERGVSGDGSSGLGLYICKLIIDLHHGEIRLYDNEGGGTVVEIILFDSGS